MDRTTRTRRTREDMVRIANEYLAQNRNASRAAVVLGLSDHKAVITAAKMIGVYTPKRGTTTKPAETSPADQKPVTEARQPRSLLFDNELEDQTAVHDTQGEAYRDSIRRQINLLFARLDAVEKRLERHESGDESDEEDDRTVIYDGVRIKLPCYLDWLNESILVSR